MKLWRRRRRYAATVIALLTLVFGGIGTVLGILSTSVLRPLPFAHPGELFASSALYDGNADLWSFDDLRRTATYAREVAQFTAMVPMQRLEFGFRGDTIGANVVTTAPDFFQVLGISTGAALLPGTAVVSSRLLNRNGLSTGDVLGSSITLGGKPLTIVAVIDRMRAYPADGEIWYSDNIPGRAWLGIVKTRGDMAEDAVADRVSRAFQAAYSGRERVAAPMRSIGSSARPSMEGAQRMLLAGIAVFSIIAILNYGLLGIGEARRRAQEFAIRVAIGATRAQVMRGLLLDQLSLVLVALCLALVGLTALALRAYGASDLVQALLHLSLPIWLALAMAFSLLLLAAMLPTRVSGNALAIEVLRRVNARGSPFEKAWNRAFVSLQFGVTCFLLVVGGVVLLGVVRDRKTAYGFDENNALIARVNFSRSRRAPGQAAQTIRDFGAELNRAFPGRATLWSEAGRAMTGAKYKLASDDGAPKTRSLFPLWMSQDVAPTFFDVMGVRLIAGRRFTDADDASTLPVIIVTARAAKDLWGTTDVIGRRMRFGEDDGVWRTVVGVAADAYPIEQMVFQLQARRSTWATSYAYRPLAQMLSRDSTTGFQAVVRGASVAQHSTVLQALLNRAAPGERFRLIETLSQYLDSRGEVARGTATMQLLLIFGACGLALGVIGAMILIDDVVRSRTNEFGIRRALGSPSINLVGLASRETLVAGVSGVLTGAIVGARFGPVVAVWLKATLPGKILPAAPVNWPLVGATVVVLILALALGTVSRAIRAARLDPAVALRES